MDDWKALITRFSDFGGIAHNIQYKKGQYGLGIFPKIQGEEIKIQVPDRLMINLKDVGYKNNKLFLMNAGKYPRGYAEWFNFYQQKFAYGANAGKEISQVFTDAKKFDKETLDIALKTTLLQNINPNKPLQLQYASKFLTARCIDYKGKPHVFPIIELINHDYKGGRYEKSNSNEGGGITVKMKPTNEVLVAYNRQDSIGRFSQYFFSSYEPMAYSLPIQFTYRNKKIITVMRNSNRDFNHLNISESENSLKIKSLLVLGHIAKPELPRKIFFESLSKGLQPKADELFNSIIRENIKILTKLLRKLQLENCSTAKTMQESIINQIEVISHN